MRVTYIHHSGVLVETEKRYYLFDCYVDTLPEMDSKKPLILLASHNHGDHYDPAVFANLDQQGMSVQAVLAKDIPKKRYPENVPVTKAYANESYTLDGGAVIKTLRSTDAGVAYIVEDEEGIIYHSGDLNDWFWEGEPDADNRNMTKSYREQIDKIKSADLAFVVLDPRQEKHYCDGMLYFLENVKCDNVFPIHYWKNSEIIAQFKAEYPRFSARINDTENAKRREIKCSSK